MRTGACMTMSKFPFTLVTVFLIWGLLCAGCRHEEPVRAVEEDPKEFVMPDNGAYTGAYVDFGEGEDDVTYDAIADFERLTGKHLALVAFGNFWGEQAFPDKTMKIVSGYGAIPLIFWSPWDKPYAENQGPDRFNLPDILAGKWDVYIDQWADAARSYGKPILVSWGLEMNGTWFPWSGSFYDGGRVTGEKDGRPLYAGPELVKQAYRYVVDRVRARQAKNILWGFHVNHHSVPQTSWNRIAQYYPGPDYVDWLAVSVYGKMVRAEGWISFSTVMDASYRDLCELDPHKPIIVAEWGVGEFPSRSKGEFVAKAFSDMQTRYPRVRGAVFWHERWENKDGSYSNLRVNSSPGSLDAYRQGVASPYWIDQPQFRPQGQHGSGLR